MKYNKRKAFTLAEVLVLLLTLTILIAAFAPVFTKRYKNQSSDTVWKFVPGDDNYNAYFDSNNRNNAAAAFVGLNPLEGGDVSAMINYNEEEVTSEIKPVYSKLIIASSKKLSGGKLQQQMQFRRDPDGRSAAGDIVGTLFAGNGNLLVGGPFSAISNDAVNNTYFAASANTSHWLTKGDNNTAIGTNALKNLQETSGNTAVGTNALYESKNHVANTAVGTYVGELSKGDYNTLLGGFNNEKQSTARILNSSYNTVLGLGAMSGCAKTERYINSLGKPGYRCIANDNKGYSNDGGYNTVVGYSAAQTATGKGNTALGAHTFANMIGGDYNTAIGYNACSFLGKDLDGAVLNKVTCIGANSGPVLGDKSAELDAKKYINSNADHVYIGGQPYYAKSINWEHLSPRAVLEVHNTYGEKYQLTDQDKLTGTSEHPQENTKGLGNGPSPSGHESVVINGNLIVRGQTYLEVPIIRPFVGYKNNLQAPKALVLFKTFTYQSLYGDDISGSGSGSGPGLVFGGFDGIDRNAFTVSDCRGANKRREFMAGATSCICTSVGDSKTSRFGDGYITDFSKIINKDDAGKVYNALPSYSYDWNTKASHPSSSISSVYDDMVNGDGLYYIDQSTGKKIYLAENVYGRGLPMAGRYVDLSLSHRHYEGGRQRQYHYSCCPNLTGKDPVLTSDIRLKNVGEKFVAGLDEIRKINVYNFTFKTDKNRVPQVGVIAQDLKRIFPNAVATDENGYYKIRWDEMLYAAINAVKTLNTKVEKLANRVATDKERIAKLKQDNAKMYAQLDKLADELAELESKNRK